MGGGDGPPPARIVLESDGAENVPLDPNAPQGAFTAARAAKDQGVQISTISFGTPDGTVVYQGATIPVPVDDQTLQEICKITDGQAFHADSLDSLKERLLDAAAPDRLRNRARATRAWPGCCSVRS